MGRSPFRRSRCAGKRTAAKGKSLCVSSESIGKNPFSAHVRPTARRGRWGEGHPSRTKGLGCVVVHLSYDARGFWLHNGASIPSMPTYRALWNFHGERAKETHIMEINTRRSFFGKIAAMAALVTGAPKLFPQQTSPAASPPPSGRR